MFLQLYIIFIYLFCECRLYLKLYSGPGDLIGGGWGIHIHLSTLIQLALCNKLKLTKHELRVKASLFYFILFYHNCTLFIRYPE